MMSYLVRVSYRTSTTVATKMLTIEAATAEQALRLAEDKVRRPARRVEGAVVLGSPIATRSADPSAGSV